MLDTSVWIEVFRKPAGVDLTRVAELDEIVTCLPVAQEVLQGFRDERAYRIARDAMLSFPIVESPLGEGVFLQAVQLYRDARRAGVTIRSSVDCLIASCAIRHDLELLHVDRDFDQLARVSSVRSRSIRIKR
jgi:predicted nucleic acid-binding protein